MISYHWRTEGCRITGSRLVLDYIRYQLLRRAANVRNYTTGRNGENTVKMPVMVIKPFSQGWPREATRRRLDKCLVCVQGHTERTPQKVRRP